MLLKNLIKECPDNIKKIDINGLALDSRNVKKKFIFFAIKGNNLNGELFIDDAIKKGAKLIVCSFKSKIKKKKVTVLKVKKIKETLAHACKKFFNKKPKNILAVTGTNGKSSVADFYHQIFSLNKINVATIGTLGIKKNSTIRKISITSPDIITLHKELEEIKKIGIDNVILEASSHGLEQGRLNGIDFKAGIFTNFSQDHLDYHKTMKKYFNAKMILFSNLIKKNRYLITDSKIKEFKKLKKIAQIKKLKLLTFDKDFNIYNMKNLNLIGSFQYRNLLMAIKAAQICGVSQKKIIKNLSKICSVSGRLQLVRKLPNKTKIFIDFAHTPDALETVLRSLKNFYKKDITIVFGCGGERDKRKRSMMSRIASKFCNKIYITDDNPRNEDPKKIRKAIIKHLTIKNYFEIGNRVKAIETAVANSSYNDIILVAGKGHETSQDYGNKSINISDKKIIKKIKLKKNNFNEINFDKTINSKILNKILSQNKSYKFYGASIDSRSIKKDNLFVAIKGKKVDGHNFVKKAIKYGAKHCIVSKLIASVSRKKLTKTNNTIKFLNELATEKRKLSNAKIIAITGSVGKTTVKTILGQLLDNYGTTYFSPKSFNNHYGVPISLSNLENSHEFGVFEVGMSKAREIHKLSKLIKPDIGIITNIAEAHIENFKNLKEIAKAKSEIINNIKPNGTLILNRDDFYFAYLNKISKKKNIEVISFGTSKNSDIYPINIKKLKNINIIKIKVIDEELNLKVKNVNIYNVLSVIAVIKKLNLDLGKIENSSHFLESLEGRGKTHIINRYKKKFKLIDESYNANPLSVKNAILNFSKIKKKNFKKYVLLGDMLELGNRSNYYHKNLSKIINNTDIDKVFVYGDKILNAYKFTKKYKQGNILQHTSDFDEIFANILKKNDYLMVKGSNSTGLNRLSKNIIRGLKNAI
jgi:MurE/MurF fusion protein